MGGPEGGPAAVKGILKPSTMRAETLSASGDGDADARRDAKGKAPLVHSRASGEDVRTHTFHRFHDRVADVFASLGPGLTRGGALASGSGAPAPPPAWMPANTSVVRRGRDVRDGSDEDSDDDDEANRAGADDDDVARRRRDESRGAYPDDLDCLASDDDDDETRRGVTLGRSVGRCAALDAEDEYDYYDDVAAASDGGDALKRKIGLVSQSAGTAGSGGAGPRREARETYVPPAKRARADAGATARGVAWDGDVREVRREPRGNAAAGARTSDLPSRRRTNSWVPDHVRNPHKYDVYALDEPLIIGGGSRDDAAEFFFAPGVVAKPGGSASAVAKPGGKLNARRTEVGGSSPPSGDARHPDGDAEDDARRTPMPAPTFSASSTATAAAREAARRRRDERRVAVVAVVANGEVPGSKAARNERLVSFDAAADDEAEDGRGGGEVAPVAGFERGSAKRFRSSRKRGTRGEDAR